MKRGVELAIDLGIGVLLALGVILVVLFSTFNSTFVYQGF